MMEMMRKAAPAIIIVIVLVFGGASFIGFGANSASMKEANRPIGSVGGENITLMEFSKAYNQALGNMRGYEMSDAERRQLPMRIWENLVRDKISEKIAAEMKLGATSEEVYKSLLENPPSNLKQSPYFADESGQFSEKKYREIMTTPETFDIPDIQNLEMYLRSLLPNQKLGKILELGNFVSPSEVEEQYHRSNDKVKFEYLMTRPYSMTVAPEKLNSDAVEAYYNANKEQFTTKEQCELYYVKVEKKATAHDEAVLSAQLVESKVRVESGEATFGEETDIESDDEQTATQGGVLGWMVKGDFPAFDPVFDLKLNDISSPIKSRLGLHIVKVDSVDASNEKGRFFLSHILKKIVPTVITLDSLDALGENLIRIAEDKGITAAALELGQKVDSTGLFGKGDAVPGVGYHSGLGNFVFDGDSEEPFELYENESGYFLVTLKERIEMGTLPLVRAESKIKEILNDSLQLEAAKNYVAALKVTGSLEEFAKGDTLLVGGVADSATRDKFVQGIGYNNKVIATAFLTDIDKVSSIIEETNGVYLVRPLSREIAEKVPAEDAKRIAKELREKRVKSIMTEWYVSYREKLGVEENIRKYYY